MQILHLILTQLLKVIPKKGENGLFNSVKLYSYINSLRQASHHHIICTNLGGRGGSHCCGTFFGRRWSATVHTPSVTGPF